MLIWPEFKPIARVLGRFSNFFQKDFLKPNVTVRPEWIGLSGFPLAARPKD